MRPFIQFSSRNIQKSNEYYLAFNFDDDCFAANFPRIAGFSKEYAFEPYIGNVSFLVGFANINDEVIPVIDLKRKIGMSKSTCQNTGKLVIVEMELFENKLKFAIMYNNLGDAFEIPEKKMMPVPNIGSQFEQGFVKGVHVHENTTIMILDFENLFNIDDLIDIKVNCNRAIAEKV